MFWQLIMILLLFLFYFQLNNCYEIHLSIEENQKPTGPIGNLVTMIKNQTKDWEKINFQLLSIEGEKSYNYGQRNYITFDLKNGDIWIQSAIDREEICQQYQKCDKGAFLTYLIIVDSKVFNLQIEIIDLNDNYPTFQPDESTIKIPEGIARFTEYSLPIAKDKDSARFGINKYEFKPIAFGIYEKYFELIMKNNNPYLRVIGELDRELIKDFEFHLYATDHGGNSGKCKITIEITDINDNTPQWIGLPYRKEISECTSEVKVLQLNAQDKDDPQTLGGQIRFRISENSPNAENVMRTFYITENTLYLNNGALKSFGQNKVSIVVVASDGARSNETTVELDIKDCNDHRPIIKLQNPNLNVNENVKNKSQVTRITVVDNDQGINSEFNCHLNDTVYVTLDVLYQAPRPTDGKENTKIFEINTVPGISFDREKFSRYTLEMVCIDSGTPTQSSSETINIFIGDENDNPPKFENRLKTFSLSEDSKIGSEVGSIVATDIDLSPNNIITYSIVGDNQINQTFFISNTGQITLSKSIDREERERYEFIVTAKDNGKLTLSDSCTIVVVVLDVNDNAPEIDKDHYFKIVESNGSEQKYVNVGKLNATDRDSGPNGTFKFRLSTSKKSDIQITTDGRLFIHGIIDREKIEKIMEQVEVIDNGSPSRTATTTVHIDILDLNDNKPKFKIPSTSYNNHVNVSFDTSVGQTITEVKAVDPDQGVNGTVNYTLIERDPVKNIFFIHNDGQIVLHKKLEDKMKSPHILTIQASDNGNPPQKETVSLYINYKRKKDTVDSMTDNTRDGSLHMDPKENSNRKTKFAISPNVILFGFLIVSIMLILIIIGTIGIYIYCRGQGIPRMGENSKHLQSNRDPNSVVYQKGCNKNMTKSDSLINNEVLLRNENYNQVGISTYQPNYTNLMLLKNNCYPPIDSSYHFGHALLTDNYSAFQPKSNTTSPDKDQQEFTPFNPDETWNSSKQMTHLQIRKKNLSECSDNVYDTEHKYAFIHSSSVNNYDMDHELNNITHFTTPSQSRRADFIQPRSDTNPKLKVNLVNSSFV